MRTDLEIMQMFKDMGLETEEKRSLYTFSYSYQNMEESVAARFVRADTKTKELMEDNDAELE